ncbi:MAG: rhodanese-like domain-containing protein, partial [Rhodospirillales bacterium]|nr:rhodanese-like domain-containing protein [Rhodospirillales bacterium]
NEGVILICRTGSRTSILSQMLTEQAGFSKVYNVTDGIVKWIDGKNPVVKAP